MNYVNLKTIQELNKGVWITIFGVFLVLSICLSFYTFQIFQNIFETKKYCETPGNFTVYCNLVRIDLPIAILINLIFNIIILILNSKIISKVKDKPNLCIYFLYFFNWLSFMIFSHFAYDSLFFNILVLQILAFTIILGNLGILFWTKSQELKKIN